MSKRILILMSDTGGGHRAAAEAIRDALMAKHAESLEVEVLDVLKHYAPFPWNQTADLYPLWIGKGKITWQVGYKVSNQKAQARLMANYFTRSLGSGLRRMYAEHPADVIVNVHPMLATAGLRTLPIPPDRPPFITVVTDLVSTHAIWYEPKADQTLVPTQPAFDHGVALGVPADKMRVTGLPVNPRFADGLVDKQTARAKLGWDADMPAILMVGGGEGMGPLHRLAMGVNSLKAHCQVAVIAGRNAALQAHLESTEWNQPTHIYGFVKNMPELMAAADILVTKAGPATISEACMAGLPVILSGAIPGQEDGNVRYIVQNEAGLYANTPEKVKAAVSDWLARDPDFLRDRSTAARKLARPDAVWNIAEEIWQRCRQNHQVHSYF